MRGRSQAAPAENEPPTADHTAPRICLNLRQILAYTGSFFAPFDGFGPLQREEFAYEHTGPAEQVIVRRVLSTSFIAALPQDERAQVAAEVRALIAAEPDLAGRDTVAMPYRTTAYRVVKDGEGAA